MAEWRNGRMAEWLAKWRDGLNGYLPTTFMVHDEDDNNDDNDYDDNDDDDDTF